MSIVVGEITQALHRWSSGNPHAFDQLVDLVYEEMRGIARGLLANERGGHTLQSTALVHETYLRLLGQNQIQWNSRAHFFGAAARAMRRILVDHARQRAAGKRGAGAPHDPLTPELAIAFEPDLNVIALDHALDQLAALDPERARVVELRYFAGLTIEETASLMGISDSAVNRDWAFARAWLFRRLQGAAENLA
ncbi:MAG: sigma-70 family RNA polymerase sigma factor [Bryobacterales bacterium]|nr:sigma-70 family RNA polymerase sigma factor [Bryobacterales bacterium]